MEREYQQGSENNVTFFTGEEVERTPAFGMRTLFVVGMQDPSDIIELTENTDIVHIYLGANQSFKVTGYEDFDQWRAWDNIACTLLDKGYWVTLDFDVEHWLGVSEMSAISHVQFIPQISVKIPYIGLAKYNTCVKIDDTDFKASNPGVWIHSIQDLTDRSKFTDWTKYTKDEIIS